MNSDWLIRKVIRTENIDMLDPTYSDSMEQLIDLILIRLVKVGTEIDDSGYMFVLFFT